MGQTLSIHHIKSLGLSGYFFFALWQSEIAFFIDQFLFECPVDVPSMEFNNLIILIYLGEINQSRGMYNPLLLIFGFFDSLLPIFYKETI